MKEDFSALKILESRMSTVLLVQHCLFGAGKSARYYSTIVV